MTGRVVLGIEKLLDDLRPLRGKSVGVIANTTSVDHQFRHIVDLLNAEEGIKLAAIFGPEHGFRGDQDTTVGDSTDPYTQVPIYSLYGETQKPTNKMLEGIDVLLFDMQDVGVRFYTYISTMAYSMQAAAELGIEFVVLDRTNPINGIVVDGPVLETGFESFVGVYPLPIRHGMTVGEVARYFNEEFDIGVDLRVVTMEGWDRTAWYDETGLQNWVLPSPNLPTLETAIVYPGMCLFEGTNVSEGRGTTRPFEMMGAPFIDGVELADALSQRGLPGVIFRPVSFIPFYRKYVKELVHGVQLHVVDRAVFQPVRTGLEILVAIQKMYPNDLEFRDDAFDRLAGNSWIRESIRQGRSA
ncbi:MAG: DUF1343 domain-containing protein, partial [Firmicutes bacterium]|nr:DUF1343 domain-containing protein [Bacillota bacterium]